LGKKKARLWKGELNVRKEKKMLLSTSYIRKNRAIRATLRKKLQR
jgi:hypothetical protein